MIYSLTNVINSIPVYITRLETEEEFQVALYCFSTLPGAKNQSYSTRDGVLWFEENYFYSLVLDWGPGPLTRSILLLKKVFPSSPYSSAISWVQFSYNAYPNIGKIWLCKVFRNIPPGLNKHICVTINLTKTWLVLLNKPPYWLDAWYRISTRVYTHWVIWNSTYSFCSL